MKIIPDIRGGAEMHFGILGMGEKKRIKTNISNNE
jgi:hypothetical protein